MNIKYILIDRSQLPSITERTLNVQAFRPDLLMLALDDPIDLAEHGDGLIVHTTPNFIVVEDVDGFETYIFTLK